MELKKRNRWQEVILVSLVAALGVTGLYIIVIGFITLSLDLKSFMKLISGSAVTAFVYFPINKLQEILTVEKGFFLLGAVVQKNIDRLDDKTIKAIMDFILKLVQRGR